MGLSFAKVVAGVPSMHCNTTAAATAAVAMSVATNGTDQTVTAEIT